MKRKIKNYIDYEFRNVEKTKEVLDAIEEVFSNLSDLYDDLIANGKTSEEAYIDTINNLGEFSKEFKKSEAEYVVKPKWADTLLVISVVAGIASLPIIFINLLIGSILLMLSVGCFSVSAYFMYKTANFALVEKKDLDYHNHTLEKIYKYVRLNISFWIISSSLIITQILTKVIVGFTSWIFYLTQDSMNVNTILDFETRAIPLFSLVLFVIILPICLIVGRHQYHKALIKYIKLTGNNHIGKRELNEEKLKDKSYFYVIIGIFLLIIFVIGYFGNQIEFSKKEDWGFGLFYLKGIDFLIQTNYFINIILRFNFFLWLLTIIATFVAFVKPKKWIIIVQHILVVLFCITLILGPVTTKPYLISNMSLTGLAYIEFALILIISIMVALRYLKFKKLN